MLIQPKKLEYSGGVFTVPEVFFVNTHSALDCKAVKNLWRGFTGLYSQMTAALQQQDFCMYAGNSQFLELDGFDYTLNVSPDGIALNAKDKESLLNGFMTLLTAIRQKNEGYEIPCFTAYDRAVIKTRMIHLCVFPETSLITLKKIIRSCAVLKYTHVIIEFWGTLKFDCLKELAWENAFSKAQIKEILDEARGLGLETVPMFNHAGHASQSRLLSGKHVVLDQNPSLANYFSEDGWSWNFDSLAARNLLKEMRKELYEIFGEGKYFHLGCDEVYSVAENPEAIGKMGDFIAQAISEVLSEGRIPIIWGDMLLRHTDFPPEGENNYATFNLSQTLHSALIAKIDKRTIIADWQYNVHTPPIKSVGFFKEMGFQTLVCPWENKNNLQAAVKTALDAQSGIMLTTWHTLYDKMYNLTSFAKLAYLGKTEMNSYANANDLTEIATLLRKVYTEKTSYEDAGFASFQINRTTRI